MVFYRKYRPQTIAELDSPKLRDTLYSVLSSKNVPHAFLFTGPKGLGKTSTARIIAKVLNCTHDKGKADIEPDNTCDQCVSITNGSNIDVLEIDGASNRGIDEIRDLRDKVKLAPSSASKKVYIIDEVHMLTTEAFNALLKTIEEPPSHVVFIFCTTEPQKVPATIVSRCFHLALARATDEEIVHALKRIVIGEKLSIDEDTLLAIAKMSDGGFRDATKILEEILSVANGKDITKSFIESYYKTTGVTLSVSTFLAYLNGNPPNLTGSLHVIQQTVEQGTDIRYFIEEVLSTLHHILLNQTGIEGTQTSYPENLRLDIETIRVLTDLFSDAYQKTKYAVVQSLPLELAVVVWCNRGNQESGGTSGKIVLNQEIMNKEVSTGVKDSGKNNTLDSMLKKERNLKVQAVLKGSNGIKEPITTKGEITHSQVDLPKNANDTAQLMDNLIYKVKPFNHSVAGVLRGCVIRSLDAGKIVFETSYKFHKERLEEGKTREILEKAIREITGKQIQVMIELKK